MKVSRSAIPPAFFELQWDQIGKIDVQFCSTLTADIHVASPNFVLKFKSNPSYLNFA